MRVGAEPSGPAVVDAVPNSGDAALRLPYDSTADVVAGTDALRAAELPGVVDIVPAARTILVTLAGPQYQAPTRQRLRRLHLARDQFDRSFEPPERGADVVIDVIYDSADLPEVARLTGLPPEQVIASPTR